MTALELLDRLFAWSPIERENRSDGLVFGDGEREVTHIAVTQIATPEVIRRAKALGASAILTHEPTLHDTLARTDDDPVLLGKRALLEAADLPILRFHDHSHFTAVDKINAGVLARLGWQGEFDGQKTFTLAEPMEMSSILCDVRDRLGLVHAQYVGAPDLTVRRVALLFGAWGDATLYAHFRREEIDLVIAGEICEWSIGEYVRDAAELGIRRGLLVLGHMGSERSGMEYVADHINREIEGVTAEYIDCGELYR